MSNLLVIDAGNTNIVLGIFRDGKQVKQGRIHTDREKSPEAYVKDITDFLRENNLEPSDMEGAAISNVVPAIQDLLVDITEKLFGKVPFFVRHDNKMDLSIHIDNPLELGADLIASAVAAIEKYGKPCIVIDFGTATTFAAINDRAEFLGGAIAQGINVSCKGLYAHAPHLPCIEMETPPSVIGKNTKTAMQSGIYGGYTHLIRGIVTDMKKILGENTKVISTGGLCGVFEKEKDLVDITDRELVMEGIYLLYCIHNGVPCSN